MQKEAAGGREKLTESGFTEKELRLLRARADERYENMRGARFYRNVDFLFYILTVVLIALGIRAFLVEPIRVDGDSMVPTLLNGEHMFVEKVSYWFNTPERGDIVICFYPGYTESCVKRVIGLPGETVEVREGTVYIDGKALDESLYWRDMIFSDTAPVTVGEKAVFVMGDNRNGSKDSRALSVGPIPFGKVEGRVRSVVWPLSAYRTFPHVEYAK